MLYNYLVGQLEENEELQKRWIVLIFNRLIHF